MKFCKLCKNSLQLKETREDNHFQLWHVCLKCNYEEICENPCIFSKTYKKERSAINYDASYLNKYYINDPTMPTKKTKCVHCNETDNNPYYVKYVNNSFQIIIICKACLKNFKF